VSTRPASPACLIRLRLTTPPSHQAFPLRLWFAPAPKVVGAGDLVPTLETEVGETFPATLAEIKASNTSD
jgi:hypothetical protein